jgi:hypothetical protein
MRKVALAACSILVLVASLTAAEAQPRYGYPGGYAYPPYAYGPAYGYGPYYPRRVYSAPVYGPPPYCGPGPVCAVDPYAAPHEIRGGYRTVYVPGRGRVILGGPLY